MSVKARSVVEYYRHLTSPSDEQNIRRNIRDRVDRLIEKLDNLLQMTQRQAQVSKSLVLGRHRRLGAGCADPSGEKNRDLVSHCLKLQLAGSRPFGPTSALSHPSRSRERLLSNVPVMALNDWRGRIVVGGCFG